MSPDFIEQFGQALEQLRSVFLTEKGQPFVLAGSGTIALLPLALSRALTNPHHLGTLGWDMAACNLLQKGDKALVVNTGYFGDRFGEWCAFFPCVMASLTVASHTHTHTHSRLLRVLPVCQPDGLRCGCDPCAHRHRQLPFGR